MNLTDGTILCGRKYFDGWYNFYFMEFLNLYICLNYYSIKYMKEWDAFGMMRKITVTKEILD